MAERPEELARPHLHEFMAAVYEHYDLVIWSATGMKWIEVKMRELGVSTHPAYKLTAFMDHKCMVTIQTEKHGGLQGLLHELCNLTTSPLLRPFMADWETLGKSWSRAKDYLSKIRSRSNSALLWAPLIGCCCPPGVFDCKPLPVLWAKIPEYTPENTIMFDDLRRNYAFNPQNGLVIRPYK